MKKSIAVLGIMGISLLVLLLVGTALMTAGQPADTAATCYVGDVHYGLPVALRGKVKYIRISQRVG